MLFNSCTKFIILCFIGNYFASVLCKHKLPQILLFTMPVSELSESCDHEVVTVDGRCEMHAMLVIVS